MEGTTQEYTLTLADNRSEPEARPPQTWKIQNPQSYGFVTLATAIRFVAEQAGKTDDPDLKKRANETLVTLKRLKQTPNRGSRSSVQIPKP
jgi:hypothetical protein